jgi:NADPH2:quinone reductase
MRAIQVTETGGPEVLRLAELPDPEPGPGQLLVELAAAGVNYLDTYFRSGAYPMPLPFIPGSEGAGTVMAVGPDTGGVAVGDRVAWATSFGSYAEQAVVSAEQAVPVPEDVDSETAAGYLSRRPGDRHGVHPGERAASSESRRGGRDSLQRDR